MICHLDITSIALHKDSEEAKQQIQREEGVFDGNLIFDVSIVLNFKGNKIVSFDLNTNSNQSIPPM